MCYCPFFFFFHVPFFKYYALVWFKDPHFPSTSLPLPIYSLPPPRLLPFLSPSTPLPLPVYFPSSPRLLPSPYLLPSSFLSFGSREVLARGFSLFISSAFCPCYIRGWGGRWGQGVRDKVRGGGKVGDEGKGGSSVGVAYAFHVLFFARIQRCCSCLEFA